jgi:hypothetical protein
VRSAFLEAILQGAELVDDPLLFGNRRAQKLNPAFRLVDLRDLTLLGRGVRLRPRVVFVVRSEGGFPGFCTFRDFIRLLTTAA